MLNDAKLNALRGAMHDLADDYLESKNVAFSDVIRQIADDPKMLQRFANLLTHYETPAAALQAMQTESTKRIEGSQAAADLSGRHTAPMIQRPRLVETPGRGRSSVSYSHAGEGNNFVD